MNAKPIAKRRPNSDSPWPVVLTWKAVLKKSAPRADAVGSHPFAKSANEPALSGRAREGVAWDGTPSLLVISKGGPPAECQLQSNQSLLTDAKPLLRFF